jgi:hypothetical protein
MPNYLRTIMKLVIKEEAGDLSVLGGLKHPSRRKFGHYYLDVCHHIVIKPVRDVGSKIGKIKRMICIWCESGEAGTKWRKLPK